MSENLFKVAADTIQLGQPAALATVISVGGSTPRSSGSRMLVLQDGEIRGTIGGGKVEHLVVKASLEAIADGKPRTLNVHLTRDLGMCCGGEMTIFIDPLEPHIEIVLFGGGHVAAALAPILRMMQCNVSIIDDRPEYANSSRFPNCTLVHEDGIEFANSHPGGPNTYFLVVTHEHQRDQDIVERLLAKPFAWLGLIGSRTKITRFFMRYRAAGLDEALFARVSAPVGLDIGAETPTEIAIAIAAEIVRVRRGHLPQPQSLSEIPIPARGGDGIARPPGLTTPSSETTEQQDQASR